MYPSVSVENKDFEGKKNYELANHLGNVLAVISDRKKGVGSTGGNYAYFDAVTLTATDYYPFGMSMPGRTYNTEGYKYSFGGKEKDTETNSFNFELRQLDVRSGRWWSRDPYNQHPSPYVAMGNSPITHKDPNGGKDVYYDNTGNHTETKNNNWWHNFWHGTRRHWGGTQVSQDRFWELSGMMANRTAIDASEPTISATRPRSNWYDNAQRNASVDMLNPNTSVSGLAKKVGLDILNDAWIDIQNVGPTARNKVQQLNGKFTTYDERQMAGINTMGVFLPGVGTAGKMANAARAVESTTFYTVQSLEDALRLRSGGSPWPAAASEAHFGQGVYTWGSLQEAVSYKGLLERRGVKNLEIMHIDINTNNLKSINVNLLNDAGQTSFMEQNSLLWGGKSDHGFEYIIRGTGMGDEHFFHHSIFNQLKVR